MNVIYSHAASVWWIVWIITFISFHCQLPASDPLSGRTHMLVTHKPCIPWYSCIVIYKPMIMHHLAQFRWTEYYSFIQPVIKSTSYFCLLSTYIYLRSESQKTKANNISERHKLYKSVAINKDTLFYLSQRIDFSGHDLLFEIRIISL